MNRILRVVGGPLKGAEIALVAGTRVKVGSGDGCDILVADPTLDKAAFELDVAEDEVTIVTPDGAAKTMLDFEAREFGSSAFAIGPAEGAWQGIVWPEKRDQGSGIGDQGSGIGDQGSGIGDQGSGIGDQEKEVPPKEGGKDAKPEDGKKPSRVSRLVSFVLMAAAVVLVVIAILCLRCCRNCREGRGESLAPRVTLAEVAARYGLSVCETNGATLVRGDLKTRADRLAATAAAFQAKPGAEVDIVDDESLFEAADALLGMVAQGLSVRVSAATNRVVALKGSVGSANALRGVLAALAADIPGLARVDCAEVAVHGAAGPIDVGQVVAAAAPATAAPRVSAPHVSAPRVSAPPVATKHEALKLPVCGIVMTPYPCIILKNGTRVSEGGEFGGYTVERIGADSLTLGTGDRTFEWKP